MSKELDRIKKRSEIAEYGAVLHLIINECIANGCADWEKIWDVAYAHFHKNGAQIANAAQLASQVRSDVFEIMTIPNSDNPDQLVLSIPSAGVLDYVFPPVINDSILTNQPN